MQFQNFNGKLNKAGMPILPADNRGLRYGDGLFETIKLDRNALILEDEHFARLWKGLQLLEFDLPKLFTVDMLKAEILKTAHKNNLTRARVRLAVYRGEGGLYDARNLLPNFCIECMPLSPETGKLNANGLEVCLYKDAHKTTDKFSQLKHNNFLPYFMGALYAKKQQCNDAILLNHSQRICDSTVANVFIIKDAVIHTPPIEEGCIAGVMRKFLLQWLRAQSIPFLESPITIDELLAADEVFLTNSIQNIRWVGSIAEKKYGNSIIKKLVDDLSRTNPAVYC